MSRKDRTMGYIFAEKQIHQETARMTSSALGGRDVQINRSIPVQSIRW